MSKSKIIAKLKERLKRDLKPLEREAFSIDRSTSAYKLMLDYVEDKEKSVVELEQYVAFIVKESKA